VAIGPETHFVRSFWLRRHRYGDLCEPQRWTRLLDDIAGSDSFVDSGVDRSIFDGVEHTYPAVLRQWMEAYAAGQDLPIAGEKTPNHALALPLLASWFPEARFLHIVRDPRAVVCSSLATPWTTGNAAVDANVWRTYVTSVRRSHEVLGTRCQSISYEQLVTQPAEALQTVSRFLGFAIDADPPGLAPVGINVEREPWKAGSNQKISTSSVDRWSAQLTRSQIAAIEGVAATEMRRWGYEPVTSARVRVPEVLKHTAHLGAHQLFSMQRQFRL